MSILFFETVDDYAKMLNKIALSTFLILYLCIYQLVYNISTFYNLLQKYLIEISAWGFKIPIAIFLPALIVAFFSRAVKLHDKISDIFKIREKYDLFEILYPLAIMNTNQLSLDVYKEIKLKRKDLMNKCFYKYASSKNPNPAIDKHLITMAIDQWSWYWMLVEAIFFLFITAIVFLFAGNQNLTITFLIISIILSIMCLPLLKLCKQYTAQEVAAIQALEKSQTEIEGIFNALQNR